MAVQTFTVSSFAQVYAALKQAEGHFFASAAYDDDTTPTMIVCEDADGNTVMTVGSNRQTKDIIGYFADSTSGIIYNATINIEIIGICENGVYLGSGTAGVLVAKDDYDRYAFCTYTTGKPKSYSPESYSASKEYDIPATADDQTVLTNVPILKGAKPYNRFANLFYAVAKQLTITGANSVTMGGSEYLCIGGRAYIKDAAAGGT